MNDLQTDHKLDFESRPGRIDPNIMEFRIGSCNGQWFTKPGYVSSYVILTVINDEPGNGHLNDVFQWFEFSCTRDGYALEVWEIMNERFRQHLIEKRGFKSAPNNRVIKFPFL